MEGGSSRRDPRVRLADDRPCPECDLAAKSESGRHHLVEDEHTDNGSTEYRSYRRPVRGKEWVEIHDWEDNGRYFSEVAP